MGEGRKGKAGPQFNSSPARLTTLKSVYLEISDEERKKELLSFLAYIVIREDAEFENRWFSRYDDNLRSQ